MPQRGRNLPVGAPSLGLLDTDAITRRHVLPPNGANSSDTDHNPMCLDIPNLHWILVLGCEERDPANWHLLPVLFAHLVVVLLPQPE